MSTATNDVDEPNREAVAAPPRRAKLPVIPVLVVALLVGGAGAYRQAHVGREATDDAQVEADVLAVPTRIAGVVTAIHFDDNQPVREGDPLIDLDDAPAKAKLAEAEANLLAATASAAAAEYEVKLVEVDATGERSVAAASLSGAASGVTATSQQIDEARAALTTAEISRAKASVDLDRAKALLAGGSIAQAQFDTSQAAFDTADASVRERKARILTLQSSTAVAQAKVTEASARLSKTDVVTAHIDDAKAKVEVAKARVATAKATRDMAALDLGYTKIRAPRAGVISKRNVNVGQAITLGQTILMIVPTSDYWITANFKETQVGAMRKGQPVEVHVDAFEGHALHGEVDSFSGATGARFSLLPPDNATGNFTKVVQRVPVRIKLKGPLSDVTLRPGMSVDVVVDTRK
ncbi:MAG: HlyD family secretion protein [Polyangiales bacterium]